MGKRYDDWIERAVPKRRWWAIVCAVAVLAGLALNLYWLPGKIDSWGFGLGIASYVIYSIPWALIGWLVVMAFRRAHRRGWGPTEPVSAAEPPQSN